MKLALFSDIHSNLEALEKAHSHASGLGIKKFMILGDTVGYGANPNECFEWALKSGSVILMGNHEKALTDVRIRMGFNSAAAAAIEWTAGCMDAKLVEKSLKLDYVKEENNLTFAHSSPATPEDFPYVSGYEDAVPAFNEMKTRICFIGHTHIPSCFCEMGERAEKLKPGIFKLPKEGKVILNPGSIGQPRDSDPRLSYGIYDDEAETFEIVRLDYDNQKAADKIRKAGLPRFLADRLL